MRAPRVTLLLAAALLVSAELVSLTLLLQATGEHQTRRADEARERAALLMPRIADWVRAHDGMPGAVVSEPWIEPFTELAIDASEDRGLDALGRSRLAAGELRPKERAEGVHLDGADGHGDGLVQACLLSGSPRERRKRSSSAALAIPPPGRDGGRKPPDARLPGVPSAEERKNRPTREKICP